MSPPRPLSPPGSSFHHTLTQEGAATPPALSGEGTGQLPRPSGEKGEGSCRERACAAQQARPGAGLVLGAQAEAVRRVARAGLIHTW